MNTLETLWITNECSITPTHKTKLDLVNREYQLFPEAKIRACQWPRAHTL